MRGRQMNIASAMLLTLIATQDLRLVKYVVKQEITYL